MPGAGSQLRPYVSRLALEWAATEPDRRWRCLDATLCFVDISGFTALAERLARRGPIGAEELTNVLNDLFSELLAVAYDQQGSLLKFGGDALLIAYEGEGHAERACWAAIGMRSALRRVGRVTTDAGNVRLRMAVGLHSGDFHLFRVGTPYREVIVTGPAATQTTRAEAAAAAGEILVSEATAALVGGGLVGAVKEPGRLLRDLRRPPPPGPGPFPAPPVDDDLVAGEMSPYLVRHLAAGIAEPEHRTASVGFVKFSGTDALLERSGPDALADALHELVSTLQTAAEAERVTLLASDIDDDGGKVIVTAGVPTAREDDEGRMLRTLRSLLDADLPLAVRAGVSRGHVFAGDVGGVQRRTYTVMGDTVNLAARLAAQAPPGHLYCTSGILDRSRSRFATTDLEPFTVKGKSAPVQALDVGAAISGPGVEEAERLTFVGRSGELGRLLELVAGLRGGGTGQVVAIVGAVGSGKSRLVRELVRRASDMRTVRVRGELYGRTTPYLPVRLLLRHLLDAGDGDAAELERRLRHAVATHAPALAPWIPLIGTVLALELEPTPEVAALEPEFQRERRDAATTEFVASLLGDRVVLVVEDAHWVDEPSLGVLRRLGVEATSRSWLVVAAMRSPEGLDAEMERMDLGPLDDADARQVVVTATDESPLRPHEIESIVERAAGNPLFLEEILRTVAATGDLAHLPDSLDSVATAEIDALPPLPRRLLRHASVLGMTFRRDVLDDVADDDVSGLDHATRTLLASYLVADGPMLLQFRNRVMRDAAYERLSYRRRRELHDRAGASIEHRHADQLDAYAELLSIHFAAAARHDKAWHYARRAGDLAAAAYANVEAAGQYEMAVEAGRRLDLAPRELAGVIEQLGDVQELAGSYEAAVESFGQARKLGGGPVDEARLLLKRSRAAERYGAMRQAVRWVRAGSRLTRKTSGVQAQRLSARLLAWEAWLRQQQGRPGVALRLCRQAIEVAEQSGGRRALAQAYMTMDRILTETGRVDEAVYSERALKIFEDLGDTYQRATVLVNNGVRAYFSDDWTAAAELYSRAEAAYMEAGSVAIAAGTRCNRAEILVNQGRLEEAEPLLREAHRVLRAASHHGATAFAASQLARVAASTGRATEADNLLDQARSLYTEIGEHGPIVEVDLYQAEAMLAGGRLEAAGIVLAATRAQLGGRPSAPLDALEAVVLARTGRAGEGRELVDASLADPSELGTYDRALLLDARDLVVELGGGPAAQDGDERARLAAELGLQARPLATARGGAVVAALS